MKKFTLSPLNATLLCVLSSKKDQTESLSYPLIEEVTRLAGFYTLSAALTQESCTVASAYDKFHGAFLLALQGKGKMSLQDSALGLVSEILKDKQGTPEVLRQNAREVYCLLTVQKKALEKELPSCSLH